MVARSKICFCSWVKETKLGIAVSIGPKGRDARSKTMKTIALRGEWMLTILTKLFNPSNTNLCRRQEHRTSENSNIKYCG